MLRSMDHPRAELLTPSSHSHHSSRSQMLKTPQSLSQGRKSDELSTPTIYSGRRSFCSSLSTPIGSQLSAARSKVTPMVFREDQGMIVEETEEQLNNESDSEAEKEEMEMSTIFAFHDSSDEDEK